MRKAWEKVNPREAFPEIIFDAIWHVLDRNNHKKNPQGWLLEPIPLDDGTKVYAIFSTNRSRADLYNLDGRKIAEWGKR